MRPILTVGIILAVVAAGFVGYGVWRHEQPWPKGSTEIVRLTPEHRRMLLRLRAETKFLPNNYPPLGYTGIVDAADREAATSAVNDVIDSVLAQPDGVVRAKSVADAIGRNMKRVGMLETEDRERTGDYMIEVWYIAGFKGATGRFAYGSAFPRPPGYGEPLPPGWTAPDKPRPIG